MQQLEYDLILIIESYSSNFCVLPHILLLPCWILDWYALSAYLRNDKYEGSSLDRDAKFA